MSVMLEYSLTQLTRTKLHDDMVFTANPGIKNGYYFTVSLVPLW